MEKKERGIKDMDGKIRRGLEVEDRRKGRGIHEHLIQWFLES